MSAPVEPAERKSAFFERFERILGPLFDARWAIGAALVVIAACLIAQRIGFGEALLCATIVPLAAIVPPRRVRAAKPQTARETPRGVVNGEALAVLSGLPDPVLLLDGRGVVRAFNDRALAALGDIRTGDPVSFSLRAPEVIEAVRSVVRAKAPQVVFYAERVPVERWWEAHVASARVGTDGPRAIIVALRDLTEQRRSERMRGDFVANASHELRTPLASVLGFIETLQGPARNDAQAREKFLAIMRAQASRMSRLIDDLLSLSRIELKAHLRPDALVDLRSLASGVADALGPLAQDRGVEIAVASERDPILVHGDRDELIRVVENLTENAIKYGQSGKRVEIAVQGGGIGREGARLTVRDFGPGVAPEHLPRLTERFYRVDVAESRDKGGTGLGLALVKHILQRHGGRLSIESEPGEGATFTMILDRASPNQAGKPPLKRAS